MFGGVRKKTAAVLLRHAFPTRRNAINLICDVFPLCGTNSCTELYIILSINRIQDRTLHAAHQLFNYHS